MVRGRDGEIRAFHNVCQHRGNRLVSERRGHVSTFVCAYHAWTFGLSGDLRGAPRTERLEGFDNSQYGLSPVRAEVFAGFVYFNFDADAEPMSALFPGAEGLENALSSAAPALCAVTPESQPEPRITLSAPVLNGALEKHLVIFGDEKRTALETALSLPPEDAPIGAVITGGTVHWAP